jgi:AGZA family xanthine/uracil permease-like MFS transporter
MSNLKSKIYEYFNFADYNTSISKEMLAGLSIYLSLAYIFILNPAILSNAKMDVSVVFIATVFASAISTLLMGFIAKLPFALAPGLEMNGFFAFVVCGTLGATWHEALGMVFWSGALCIVLSHLKVRQKIVDSIPNALKKSMAVSVGVFVFTIGLFLAGVVEFDNGQLKSFGNPFTTKGVALLIALVISIVLGIQKLKFPAGMLVAIILTTIFCKTQGIVVVNPAKLSPEAWAGFLDISKVDFLPSLKFLPIVIVFFLVDFYGSIGKFIGLTAATNLTKKDGTLVNIDKAMQVDGYGTSLGAVMGTSSIITYVESAVGIAAGGRTGLVAIVCGLLMFASLLFTPLVGIVPVEATAGVLCYVGYLLLPNRNEISMSMFDYIVFGAMGVVSFLTFSLDKAMLIGFSAYTVKHIIHCRTNGEKINIYFVGSTILVIVSVVLQYVLND